MARNHYPEEFRRKAVDLFESDPTTTFRSLSTDLGVSRSALETWVAKYGTGARAPKPSATTAARVSDTETPEDTIERLETQLATSKAETRKLITERDILRQAAKYFAGETNW